MWRKIDRREDEAEGEGEGRGKNEEMRRIPRVPRCWIVHRRAVMVE